MQGTASTETDTAAGLSVHRVVAVRASEEPGVLVLRFADGFDGRVDLRPMIRPGTVTEALAEPAVFAQVRVGPGGRFVEWPGEVDFCADALRMQAKP